MSPLGCCRSGSDSGGRHNSVRMGIRGDRVGMATKAALEPSQLETHITSLMRASFGRLKVTRSGICAERCGGCRRHKYAIYSRECLVGSYVDHNFIAAAAAECTSALCTGADSISPSVANFLYGVFCTLPGGIKGTALTCCG